MGKKKASKDNGGVNKSQAIRDALAKNPTASPKQLSADLNAQGVEVSPAFVSMIKFATKKKKKRAKKNRATSQDTGVVVIASDLVEAKKLVDRVGGVEKAKSLLSTLKRLL